MKPGILFTIIYIAAAAVPTWVNAQKVYRCGQSYSQTPCAGGDSVDVTDSRTTAQQKQTGQAATRDARAASTLEKERLKQEKADLAANSKPVPAAPPKAVTAAAPVAPASKPKKTRKSEPEFFTAQAPGPSKAIKPTAPAKPATTASSPKKSP